MHCGNVAIMYSYLSQNKPDPIQTSLDLIVLYLPTYVCKSNTTTQLPYLFTSCLACLQAISQEGNFIPFVAKRITSSEVTQVR